MSIDDKIDFEALSRRLSTEGVRGPVSRIEPQVTETVGDEAPMTDGLGDLHADDAVPAVEDTTDDVSLAPAEDLAALAEENVAALFSQKISWDEPAEPESVVVSSDDAALNDIEIHSEADAAEASAETPELATSFHDDGNSDFVAADEALDDPVYSDQDDADEYGADEDVAPTFSEDVAVSLTDDTSVLQLASVATMSTASDALPEIATRAPEIFPDGMAFNADERRPRVCLMGEFSAGKSTLTNLLLGARSLPVNVTATQLPPVWISYGDKAPYRVDLDGNESPVDLNQIEGIPVEETSHIRIFRRAEILEECDLIDMPGISDPNMSAEVWQRMLPEADGVIWCTHATQAWRQSEAAVWSMMDPSIQEKSILLLTRMDKILTDRDRMRVMRRVGKETTGLFRAQFGVSLLKALDAGKDTEAWAESGAEAFITELSELVVDIAAGLQDPVLRAQSEMSARSTSLTARPRPVAQVSDAGILDENTPGAAPSPLTPRRIRPRAVSIDPSRRRSRPSPGSNDLSL